MGKESIKYWKIKNGKKTRIRKPKNMDTLLDKGFTISTLKERKDGVTEIKSYSPLTKLQAWERHKKVLGKSGIPF